MLQARARLLPLDVPAWGTLPSVRAQTRERILLSVRRLTTARATLLVPSTPVFAYIELTPQCNNHCQGCGNIYADSRNLTPLPLGQWCTVLQKLQLSLLHVCLTGGEPTLYPEFGGILARLREFGFSFSLFTNARWHSPGQVIELLCSSPRLVSILVSLHGPDSSSHDTFTGVKGSFTETCENISRAVSADLPVSINTVITRLNYDRIDEVVHLGRDLRALDISFSRYVTSKDDDLSPSNDQLISAMDAVHDRRRAGEPVFASVCIPQCFHPSSFGGCLAGITYCTVNPWGSVRPCVFAPLLCGNLLEQSVEEIWHGEAMQSWRGMIPQPCTGCVELYRCHGGCHAVAMMRGLKQDYLMRQPILEEKKESSRVDLPKGARPVGRFIMRPEPFGYILVRGSRIIPVTPEAKPVLEACDGRTRLEDLRERWGQDSLDFIAMLYLRGMMDLQ
jgi:radical SAM protein with 4Fe4S-binding SPASM domain